jgi:uncharacterized protein (DUF305 family)
MDTKPLLFGIVGFILGGLLVSTVAQTTRPEPDSGSMGMAHLLEGKSGEEFDQAFLAGMIVHHEDAVTMANLAKQHAQHDELKTLADDIVAAQSKEIELMRDWQTQWGYEPSSSDHGH